MALKLFILLCVAAFAMANLLNLLSDAEEWIKFKLHHKKIYQTPHEEALRYEIFKNNLKHIREQHEKYKAGHITSFEGVNEFSDLTKDEFSKHHTGFHHTGLHHTGLHHP